MARSDPQLNIRVPQKLKDLIEQTAKENNRSVTQEVIIRLQFTFDEKIEINSKFTDDELKQVAIHLAHFFKENPDWEKVLKK